MFTPRLYQVHAATTQKARSPTVQRHVCGTTRANDDVECKRCTPGRLQGVSQHLPEWVL